MDDMKTAVIFYSVSGQTRYVASAMKHILKCDSFEIQTEEIIKPDLFSRYYRGIKQIRSNELPKLRKMAFNADEYDCIIIGSPTWASSCAPAINAFAKENEIEDKKICFFTTYAGHGDKKCIEKMTELFPNNDFVSSVSFKNPKKMDKIEIKKEVVELGNKLYKLWTEAKD